MSKIYASGILFLAAATVLPAQIAPEVTFCPAGMRADGFIDWTKLPQAPASGSVNATIPVSGVPNLFATFQTSGTPSSPINALYQTVSPADLSVSLGISSTILFSRPIQGVSATLRSVGRDGHQFTMTANSATGGNTSITPPQAQLDSDGFDFPSNHFFTSPLEIRSTSANLVSVGFQYTGNALESGPYDLINLRIESGSSPDPAGQVPLNGLREWLRADKINAGPSDAPGNLQLLASWPDQSGKGADAIPDSSLHPPLVLLDGPNCSPVVSFGGSNGPARLSFNLPINGWTAMTVFLAAQSYADAAGWFANQPLFWNETQRWGTTFVSPSQTGAFFRFGTTQVNNQPIYTRPFNIGGDFGLTTAVHSGTTDSLYINGVLALRQQGKFPAIAGTVPTATIGAGLNNTFFTGNIGEILIYDRALGDDERQVVEHYLTVKYGIR